MLYLSAENGDGRYILSDTKEIGCRIVTLEELDKIYASGIPIEYKTGRKPRIFTTSKELVRYKLAKSKFSGTGESIFIDNYEIEMEDNLITAKKYNVAQKCVIVPEYIEAIDVYVFRNYAHIIEEVHLEKTSIQKLKARSFFYCEHLKSITLPEALTEIEDRCFARCGSLCEIQLPKGLTYLGESAFANSRLKSIKIPQGIKKLCGSMFSGCRYLSEVELPDGLEKIYNRCFSECESLKFINIPETVTYLGEYAFYDTPLGETHLPDNIQTIDNTTFSRCFKIKLHANENTVTAETLERLFSKE